MVELTRYLEKKKERVGEKLQGGVLVGNFQGVVDQVADLGVDNL